MITFLLGAMVGGTNASGVVICHSATWRTTRKIADALNAERWRA